MIAYIPHLTATLIPGEEEVGPQWVCISCGEAWPDDPEFYAISRHSGRLSDRCRACTYKPKSPERRARFAAYRRERRRREREAREARERAAG